LSWVEQTYWVLMDDGRFQAVSPDGKMDLAGILGDEGVKVVRATVKEPCDTCHHIHICMDSMWNGGRRMGGPEGAASLSSVHTCKSCNQKVLNLHGVRERLLVPDGCLRWEKTFGAALDCGGCEAEKRALREAHPLYAQQMKTSGEVLKEFFSPQKEGEPPRDFRKAAEAIVGGLERRMTLTPERLVQTQRVLGHLIVDIRRRFELDFSKERAGRIMQEWLEAVYLSLQRHPDDPEKVAHEFVLVFNDTPPFSQAWVETGPAKRRFTERIWAGLIIKALQAG